MDEKNTSPILALTGPAQASGKMLREQPANIEAEQALLAAILTNNHTFEKVGDYLHPYHFFQRAHAKIFEACQTLIERGQLATAITLKNKFEADGDLEEIGGARYLHDIQSASINVISAQDYGRLIFDLYLRRELIVLGEDVVNTAYTFELDQPALSQIESAEQKLYNLAEVGLSEGGLLPFASGLTRAIEMAEAAYKRDGHISGVATGLNDLDKLLGGLHKSDLLILAGRPSMGKTSLATNIAYNVAKSLRIQNKDSEGGPPQLETVAFFSLEMSSEQLAGRILSERSGISTDSMRKGALSREDMDLVFQSARELESLRLFIDDTPALTVPAIRTRSRRLKRQESLSLIVIDYLQLIQASGGARGENRVQEISEITRSLKALAKELDVPVLALSQLSRAVEQRDDKRPQLSDLRESGSIEQDADIVMFVYREEYYLSRSEPQSRADENEQKFEERYTRWRERMEKNQGLAEVIVAKQRHGPIGKAVLMFDGNTTKFANYANPDYLPETH